MKKSNDCISKVRYEDYNINPNISIFKEITVEPEEEITIASPFDPNLIDIDTRQPTISNIIDLIANNELDLSPAFQRNANLWDEGKQSRLIESILLRIPLPALYFDIENKASNIGLPIKIWHVVDGLQRLCSIRNFILAKEGQDKRHLRLSSLEFLKLNGKSFCELPPTYQRIILQTQLIVYLIKPGTPENVKFNIFKRVNTGGIPLTQQEIRHALNQGKVANFLEKLASSKHFTDATRKKIEPSRMLDREFVNRFLAFYLLDLNEYDDLDSFMNLVLRKLSEFKENQLVKIEKDFYDSLDTIHACLGNYSFCKLDDYPRLKPINKSLFEVLTVSIAKLKNEERKNLRKNKNFFESYIELFKDSENSHSLNDLVSHSTSDKKRIQLRYKILKSFLQRMIND